MRIAQLVTFISAFGVFSAGAWLGCSSTSGGGAGAVQDSGPATDTGATTDGPAVSCTDYCAAIQSACKAADGGPTNTNQYYDQTNCMNTCKLWQSGSYGDNADTVGCRQAQAHQAASDPTKCAAAGPGGGGVCGARCDDYCTMVMAHCTVANGADPPYASNADCMSACMGYPYDTTGPDYDPNAISKLNCLDYHLRESLSDLSGQGIMGGHCDDLSIDGGATRGACHP